jgi:hypothetical protein
MMFYKQTTLKNLEVEYYDLKGATPGLTVGGTGKVVYPNTVRTPP